MPTLRSAILAAALATGVAGPALAQDVDASLRQQAIDTCSGDAVRLCPLAMFSESSVVSCMADKRDVLSRSCRAVYDRVVHVLRR